uniref:J domain-containing protein n=1 Tax=Davidia involucrata TaxID=16924 RepID=A0A5B6YS37_DAVIN
MSKTLPMIGTLTFLAGTSPQFLPENRLSLAGATRSYRKMLFAARNPCKAAVHAFTETALALHTTKHASLYEVLRIRQNASPMEIKTAYRSLAKLYHPDASHSEADGRDFIEIHNAYATLSDPAARALYDISLSAGSGRRSFGYSAENHSGFYPTRRWETDQCW